MLSILSALSGAENILKRGSRDLQPRQLGNCTDVCTPFLGFATCTTTDCVCTPLNNGSPSALTACTDCLQPIAPEIAGNITLLAGVCAKCLAPCNTTLAAHLEGASCTNSTCGCAPYFEVGVDAIEACGNCVTAFDPADGQQVLAIPQECNITKPTSSASSSGSAAPATVSVTPISHSGAIGANEMLWKLSVPGVLGILGVGLLLL